MRVRARSYAQKRRDSDRLRDRVGRVRRCRDQPGADDAGPQSAAAAGVAARFEILGMLFTNELCNNCANHTISRNYIMQTLRNIRRHYANNTQSLRKKYSVIKQINYAIYTDITQTLRRHYADITQIHYAKYTKITQILRKMFLRNYHTTLRKNYANSLRK